MSTLAKWSVEEYHRMIESGVFGDRLAGSRGEHRRVELLEGKIVEVSPEGPLHRYTNDIVAEYLRELLRGRAKVFEAHPITLSTSEPEPDIAVVGLPNTKYLTRHPYPEDIYWLIEIFNTSLEDDLSIKKTIYARDGIDEYWVIDLQNTVVNVFREPIQNDYRTKFIVTQGNITLNAFPDIQIELEKLFGQ